MLCLWRAGTHHFSEKIKRWGIECFDFWKKWHHSQSMAQECVGLHRLKGFCRLRSLSPLLCSCFFLVYFWLFTMARWWFARCYAEHSNNYCTGPSLWPKRKPFCHEWVLHPHRSVGAIQHCFWKLWFCTFILFSPISKTPTVWRDFQGVVSSIPSPRHIYILFPNIKYFNSLFSTLR